MKTTILNTFEKAGWLPYVSQLALWVIAGVVAFKVPGDPDMGWHLANGAYTLEHLAVQRGDVYSWTMPGYQWISHEWAMEVIMALVNSTWGLLGLSLMFMVITVIAFWLAARAGGQSQGNTLLLTIVGALICYPILGARPQMLTLLGIAIVLNLLFTWRRNPNLRFLLWFPFLFFIWANLHAGFAGGFVAIGVFGVAEFLKWVFTPKSRQKAKHILNFGQLLQLAGFGALSVIATLINPYSWRLYDELWTTLSKPDILMRIAEWQPVDFASLGSYNLMIAGAVIFALLVVNRWRTDYTKLTLALAFYLVAIVAWRNLALFAVISLPLFAEQLEHLAPNVMASLQKLRLGAVLLIVTAIFMAWWHIQLNLPMFFDKAVYAAANDYPYGAIQYMKEKNLPGNLFNEYNWGGYLIWQYPEKKVFIDGRMAIWETPKVRIFDEFQDLMGAHRQTSLDLLDKWKVDLVLTAPVRPVNGTLSLATDEWILLYQDEESMLWQRINKAN